MARILFAWELGGGAGHIHIMAPLARELAGRGHRVFMAVRDLPVADRLLADSAVEVLPAPYWSGRVGGLPPSASFSEVLLRVGYLDADVVLALCRAWTRLFALSACDLVIAEHAPTALLAALADQRPRAIMGTGFSLPPDRSPMPSLEAWRHTSPERLAQAEQAALGTINSTLQALSRPIQDSVADVLRSDASLLCTVAELDHYQPVRTAARYLGALTLDGGFGAPKWPRLDGPKVFAYMHSSYAQFPWVARALGQTGLPTLFVASGARAKTAAELTTASMEVTASAVDITAAAAAAAVVVSHSPHGTLWDVMRCGTPQVLVPGYVEQAALAYNFSRTGAALMQGAATPDPSRLRSNVDRTISEPSFAAAAGRLAECYRAIERQAQLEHLCTAVAALL